MTTITVKLTTPIIFGARQHVFWAEKALDDNVITEEEFDLITGRYQHCIFSGRRMSENLQKNGDEINQKIYAQVYLKDRINFINALEEAIARYFNCKYYEVSIFLGEKGDFKFNLENGTKMKASYVQKNNILKISICDDLNA